MRFGALRMTIDLPSSLRFLWVHPKLAGWIAKEPELRDAPSTAALKKDRDYVLVETCRPDEFQPSLTAFDQIVDSLTFH